MVNLGKDGCDDRDVGDVRAAVVGRIEHVDVAGAHGTRVRAQHALDGLGHGAKVHGHVGRVGDEVALRGSGGWRQGVNAVTKRL